MGEMASLWGYAEYHEVDQLGQKLLLTTLELEKLKSETMEEMRKNKAYVEQLIHLLKCAIQERDEAINKIGKLIGSSPIDSLFDGFSSPELSNINLVAKHQPLIQIPDQESLIIDSLVKGRVLPEKGTFLKAVIEAGPLLQTLLMAGPLPRWRNPPHIQPFQILPVSIRGGDAEVMAQSPELGVGRLGSMSSHSFGNFDNVVSGDCLSNGNNVSFILAKRQRFC